MIKRLKILYLFILIGGIIFSYGNIAYASDCQDVSDCYGSIEAGIDVAAAMTYLLAGMMLYAEIVTFFLAPEIAIPIIVAKGSYEFVTGKDLYKTWADDANFKTVHRHAYTEEQLKLSWMERVIGVLPLATVIGLEAREMSEAWQLSKEIRLAEEVSTGAKEVESVGQVGSKLEDPLTSHHKSNLGNPVKTLDEIIQLGAKSEYSQDLTIWKNNDGHYNSIPKNLKHLIEHKDELSSLEKYGKIQSVDDLDMAGKAFFSKSSDTKRYFQSLPGGVNEKKVGQILVWDNETREFGVFTSKSDGSIITHTHFIPNDIKWPGNTYLERQLEEYNYIEIK